MAVTVAPDVERRLGDRVVLLIRSDDPPERERRLSMPRCWTSTGPGWYRVATRRR